MTQSRRSVKLIASLLAVALVGAICVVWVGAGPCQPASAQSLVRAVFPDRQKPPVGLKRSVTLGTLSSSPDKIPGVLGKDYQREVPADYVYLQSRGVTSIRVPFLWERLQPTMYGRLDQRYLGYLRASIKQARKHGMGVVLDMHNFGKRYVDGTAYDIGTTTVPIEAVVDAWRRISYHFKADSTVIAYEFMNEPGNLPRRVGYPYGPVNNTLTLMNQAIISKLRSRGETHWFAIATEGYQTAQTFTYYYGENTKRWWTDPLSRTMVAVHYYLDTSHVGSYVEPWTAQTRRAVGGDLLPVLRWGQRAHVPIYVSEIGVPERRVGQQNVGDVARWMSDFDQAAGLIYSHGAYLSQWSAGANYLSPTTSQPLDADGKVDYSKTSLQLRVLMRHWGCAVPAPTAPAKAD